MKKAVLFCLFAGLSHIVSAQQATIDSLRRVLRSHPQADTFRVNRLNDLTNIWGLPFSQYDSLAAEALTLSRKLGYTEGQAKALFTRGMLLYSMNRNNPAATDKAKQGFAWLEEAVRLSESTGNKPQTVPLLTGLAAAVRMSNTEKKQAFAYDRRALALATALHDQRMMADCERLLAMDYEMVDGNYPAALAWNMQALRRAQAIPCPECQLFPLRAMGHLYTVLNDHRQAVSVLNQALRVCRQQGGEAGRHMEFYVLSSLGTAYEALSQYPKALRAFDEAVAVRKKEYPEITNTIFDTRLTAIYAAMGQNREAIAHGTRGLVKARQDENDWWTAEISSTLSEVYRRLNRPDSALFYGKQGFAVAMRTHKKDLIRDASEALAVLYASQKKFGLAYQYQTLFYTYRDSLVNEEVTRKAAAAQYAGQLKDQKARVAVLTRENELAAWQRNGILAGAALLLLLAGAVAAWLLNRSRLRRLREAQRLRQQIARDLHDEVGSTLSSISLLSGHTDRLLSENRPETAQRMVQKIYADARDILESIDEIIWTINPGNDSTQRIIQRLRDYAQPLMESKNIRFTLTAEPEIELLPITMEVRRNLYLIGKEAINNLVKYADATQATVRFERRKDQLVVIIEDNGRGFDTGQASIRNGQQSMQQRARAMDGDFSVRSKPEQGTTLTLSVPII
ncbi:ATP-binding protein [Arsenicibacter rosenii]|uniref:Histidine kinase domain-containing protein n=1 Tax=Arsenicibacter rosenii TaxID=1750698 RepID=A0A1S2VKN3_9BACT|nr:sensor histidine kinase [Arsenicibacter rosenii]OIN59337.1 hypothetical protein BLX24_10170 [Arsenicibacter rosenii]